MRNHLAAAAAVLVAGIWLSSGTMAPYAATVVNPPSLEPCHYLINVDHRHHIAPFFLLGGLPPEYWDRSVVLRRILYPIVAYPFVLVADFMWGGLIANMAITVTAMVTFARHINRRFGSAAAIAVAWLLSTYPGITYWAGLPYGYAAIVPASIVCLIMLYRLDEAQRMREVFEAALLMGFAFLAYDLLPFFLPAAVLTLVVRRRWLWAAAAAVVSVLPSLALTGMYWAMGVDLARANSSIYLTIVRSYLLPAMNAEWTSFLAKLPLVLVSNFFYSNFVFLPALFVAFLLIANRSRIEILRMPERALLVTALAIFLFNNAAPLYDGWQMRGEWVARLYQPVFVAMLVIVARLIAARPRAVLPRGLVVATILANALVVVGPVTLTPLGPYLYHKFYAHSPGHLFLENMHKFGRRPLGVCSTSHGSHKAEPGMAPAGRRPSFMYRYKFDEP